MPKLADKTLTATAIDKLKPRETRFDVFDAALRGFGLRVSPSGTKTWFTMRRVNGRMSRTTLGRYPDIGLAAARRQAAAVLVAMGNGVDPVTQRAPLFLDVFEEWLERDQAGNRSRREAAATLRRDALPAFRGRLDQVTRADIIRLLDKVVDRGAPVLANRLLAYLRRLFNWSVERG